MNSSDNMSYFCKKCNLSHPKDNPNYLEHKKYKLNREICNACIENAKNLFLELGLKNSPDPKDCQYVCDFNSKKRCCFWQYDLNFIKQTDKRIDIYIRDRISYLKRQRDLNTMLISLRIKRTTLRREYLRKEYEKVKKKIDKCRKEIKIRTNKIQILLNEKNEYLGRKFRIGANKLFKCKTCKAFFTHNIHEEYCDQCFPLPHISQLFTA